MAYFYVKSGGSATGDVGREATARTGTFEADANNYADITAALAATTPPASGDFIMCSSSHAAVHTTAETWTIPDNVTIISVDNANQDQYLAGAKETVDNAGSTLDLTINSDAEGNNVTFYGMTLEAEDRLTTTQTSFKIRMVDCTWHSISTASGKGWLVNGDGQLLVYKDSVLDFSGAVHTISIGQNGHVILDNCTGSGTLLTKLITPAGNGRTVIEIINTDLNTIMATSSTLVGAVVASNDGVRVEMHRCKLPTGFAVATSWALKTQIVNITECDQGGGYHYFYHETNEGTMEEDTTTYLNATYDGSTGFSAKCTASADASPMNPLRFKLGTIPAQNLATAQTVTVECTSDASLTDNDIWIEIEHNNNTDEALGDVVTTQNTDPLAAGTALTTAGTGTWTSGDTEDYIITKDLGALTNVDNGNVTVYACIGAASVVANFDLPTIAVT